MRDLDKKLVLNKDVIESPNLCDRFTTEDLYTIGQTCWQGYTKDKQSRFEWETRMNAAMNLAMQMQRPKNWPWPGCSNVVFPLVTIAALQFSARSYSNMIQGANVVKYRTLGDADPKTIERAKRIGRHMSWQVLEEDQAWEEQHDRLLINLSVIGSAFIKTYYDSSKGYVVGELVMAKDLILDYFASSVEAAQRKTHRFPLYPNEVYERAAREVFIKVQDEEWFKSPPPLREHDIDQANRHGVHPPQPDWQSAYQFLEQHTWWDLDKDGYAEPYTMTLEESSHKLVRLVSRVDDLESQVEKVNNKTVHIKPTEYFTKYSFIPSPDGGIYDLGFGIFLGPINETVNSAINQLIDSGTMQTSLGGLLGRGAKIRGGVYTMAPWEWRRVDSTGDDLRKNVYAFPDRAPSDVLFKLIGLLVEYANRISGTTDETVGKNPGQNTPASTFQGMTEQGMQVYGMIFKRVWRCMKEEFKQRFNFNRVFARASEKFGSGNDFIRQEDYLSSPDQLAPVANPRFTSVVMRTQAALALKQFAMSTSGYDVPEVEVRVLESMEVDGISQIFPGPGKVPPGHEFVNPKVQAEQMKLQGIQIKIQAEKLKWANELLEEKRVNDAKIRLIEAQALKAMAEAKNAQGAQQLEEFNAMIEGHRMVLETQKAYGEMLDKRIQALLGGKSSESDDGEGVSKLEGKSSDRGDPDVSIESPGGTKISVGGGGVSSGDRRGNGAS